jgi:hypothetical protein
LQSREIIDIASPTIATTNIIVTNIEAQIASFWTSDGGMSELEFFARRFCKFLILAKYALPSVKYPKTAKATRNRPKTKKNVDIEPPLKNVSLDLK